MKSYGGYNHNDKYAKIRSNGILVITMTFDEVSTLYTKNGKKIGEIRIVDISGDKVRVGLHFSKDEVAIARPGITMEEAISICNKKR